MFRSPAPMRNSTRAISDLSSSTDWVSCRVGPVGVFENSQPASKRAAMAGTTDLAIIRLLAFIYAWARGLVPRVFPEPQLFPGERCSTRDAVALPGGFLLVLAKFAGSRHVQDRIRHVAGHVSRSVINLCRRGSDQFSLAEVFAQRRQRHGSTDRRRPGRKSGDAEFQVAPATCA